MNEQDALAKLPEIYASVLRLRGEGLGDDRIAAALDLEPKAVGPLLRLAEAKLAALRESRVDEEGSARG